MKTDSLQTAGYQALSGVTPRSCGVRQSARERLSTRCAVVGHRDVMEAARRTWISSTLAGEGGIALAAAGAVLDWYEARDVCDTLPRPAKRCVRWSAPRLRRPGSVA